MRLFTGLSCVEFALLAGPRTTSRATDSLDLFETRLLGLHRRSPYCNPKGKNTQFCTVAQMLFKSPLHSLTERARTETFFLVNLRAPRAGGIGRTSPCQLPSDSSSRIFKVFTPRSEAGVTPLFGNPPTILSVPSPAGKVLRSCPLSQVPTRNGLVLVFAARTQVDQKP